MAVVSCGPVVFLQVDGLNTRSYLEWYYLLICQHLDISYSTVGNLPGHLTENVFWVSPASDCRRNKNDSLIMGVTGAF